MLHEIKLLEAQNHLSFPAAQSRSHGFGSQKVLEIFSSGFIEQFSSDRIGDHTWRIIDLQSHQPVGCGIVHRLLMIQYQQYLSRY